MATYKKNRVELGMPDDDEDSRLYMERCCDFMAMMIQKYGNAVLAEIEAKEKALSVDGAS